MKAKKRRYFAALLIVDPERARELANNINDLSELSDVSTIRVRQVEEQAANVSRASTRDEGI